MEDERIVIKTEHANIQIVVYPDAEVCFKINGKTTIVGKVFPEEYLKIAAAVDSATLAKKIIQDRMRDRLTAFNQNFDVPREGHAK